MADDTGVTQLRGSLPEKIGRYRILRCVGRGAMGLVYAAVDEQMGRNVAIKVLIADLEDAPETRARFYREAQAAARLVHPNIITIFDAGEDQGRSYIVMQLLEGWPLVEYLQRPEAASLDRKVDLMIQMCEGLVAAHGQGVIHRDLKPNNLFVQNDGLLKIYDFGVARLAESNMTAIGSMLGTPDYMSPEQARGEQVDARSDIFSAGAVFYYMLAGRKPFPGTDLPAVLRQLQFEEPTPFNSATVPQDLSALLFKALAKQASDRPPRVQDLLAGLVRFRRQYQAETRRLAATGRARYEAVQQLSVQVAEVGAVLGIGGPGSDASLQARLPQLAGRGAAAFDAIQSDRARVNAVLHELEAERARLSTELEGRRGQAAHIETGRALVASGDARGGLRLFESVLAAYPGADRARELADECRPVAQAQEARDRRVTDLTSAARRALDAQDWAAATTASGEVLALVPNHPVATALLAEADQAIQQEKRRHEAMIQRAVQRTLQAIDRHALDEATAALLEVEALQPSAEVLADLRHRLTEAQAAAEAAELLTQMSAEEVRLARAAFRRGRFDEAVQQLHAFLDVEPQARLAEAELDRLVKLRQALASSSVARGRRVKELLDAARPLADQGALTEAIAQARSAMRADPSNLATAAFLDDLLERDLQKRVSHAHKQSLDQRAAEAEPLLAAARDALGRGYLSMAQDAALAACRIAPARPDAVALAESVRRSLEADDDAGAPLGDLPMVEIAVEPPQPEVAPPAESGGWLSHVNHWASDLLKRRSAKNP